MNRLPRTFDEQNHTDTGCHAHPRCLTCPFERCIFEEGESVARTHAETRKRNEQIKAYKGYASREEMARRYGLAVGTISRIWGERSIS